MIRKMIICSVSLVLFFVFCSVSEAASLKNQILGKWFDKDGTTIEFFKEGTVIIGSGVGDYKFIDDNRLRMDVKGGLFGSGAMVFEVSIDKEGALNLKEPTAKVSKFLTEKAYQVKLEAQRKFEKVTNAFIENYKIGEKAGIPVVLPPDGADVYLKEQMCDWVPILKLKRGVNYKFHMSSIDLMHCFSNKTSYFEISAGHDNILNVTPKTSGTFRILCKESCGFGHGGEIIVSSTPPPSPDLQSEKNNGTGISGSEPATERENSNVKTVVFKKKTKMRIKPAIFSDTVEVAAGTIGEYIGEIHEQGFWIKVRLPNGKEGFCYEKDLDIR